jgi:periplasmic protein TonB
MLGTGNKRRMSRARNRRLLLAVGLLASGGCSYHEAPQVGPPPSMSTRPAAAPQVATPTEPGCREPGHQPFPPDEGMAVQYPKLEPVERVPPSYPELARDRKVQGQVVLRALVCEHGRVVKAYAIDSIPLLDDAAMAALGRWTFQPKVLDGQPIAAWTDVPMRFTLH